MAPLPSWIESHDPRFDQLVLFNAELELLADGFRWVEGPVWLGDHNCLLFNDIPNNRTMRWSPEHGVSVFREPSDYGNGQTRDRQGRLITCHHASRCLTRLEPDGTGHHPGQPGAWQASQRPQRRGGNERWLDLVQRSPLWAAK